MCFSATASFATSAALIPLGVLSLQQLPSRHSTLRAFAAIPLLFGIQQGIEGLLWLALDGSGALPSKLPALAFLFFVFCVWPVLIPRAAYLVEPTPGRRRLFGGMQGIGVLFGTLIFVPLLMNDGWFSVHVELGSVHYSIVTLFDGLVPLEAVSAVYTLLALLPMLLSSWPRMRQFGLAVLTSFVVSVLLYSHAFISVWCFFAALLSLHVVWIMRHTSQTAPTGMPAEVHNR